MVVHVKLFAMLRNRYPDLKVGEAKPVELDAGATVDQLIECLDLPREQVKVVFVNNVIRSEDHVLQDGDVVGMFPSVGGG